MTLVAPAELAAHLSDPDLRIADVRWSLAAPAAGSIAYAAAHLPDAVFVDLEAVLTAAVGPGRHPLPDPRAFADALGALGIGREHRVVAYDDAGGTVAGRLWWMLDALGHPRAEVLDGGIGAWAAAGLPLEAGVTPHPPAGHWPDLPTAWPRTIDRDGLTRRLGSLVVLDARAPERYRGEVEPVDPVPGHIPTAVSAPGGTLLGEDGRFLEPSALAARLAALGATESALAEGRVVVSCGSGVTACQLALAVRAAGLPDPLLYPGSYSDWSRSGMPVATGAEPGPAPGAAPRS